MKLFFLSVETQIMKRESGNIEAIDKESDLITAFVSYKSRALVLSSF